MVDKTEEQRRHLWTLRVVNNQTSPKIPEFKGSRESWEGGGVKELGLPKNSLFRTSSPDVFCCVFVRV